MNYLLIAITVGDMLKYTTSINEINRLAGALFRFRCEHFPNDSITSQRAGLIYDWILSLARQEMENDKRNELLASFCRSITPKEFKEKVDDILIQEGIVTKEPEKERFIPVSPPNFSNLTDNHALGKILSDRWLESQNCVDNSLFLSALIMMGSMLEGTLLAIISNNPESANKAVSVPKDKQTGKPKKFYDWSLSEMIIVAHELKWLQTDVKDFSMVLRDYRNMVHPWHQVTFSNLAGRRK